MAKALALLLCIGCAVVHGTSVPTCTNYTKNGVGPVLDRAGCRTACETAEGLSQRSCGLEDYKTYGKCDCITSCSSGSANGYRSVCNNNVSAGVRVAASAAASLAALLIAVGHLG
uniref:Uncharacterized protein n=1 Tax=Alexandrium andersonii TaxID=327968 RepID=A0A6U6U5S7_9DINO|mmetsp:Transcript_76613/g.171392  ORF Transcript_76613/g.171392 Transcript_76613/m.171392 type:complete len:115 (+) Transcript_76613:79-423(+)